MRSRSGISTWDLLTTALGPTLAHDLAERRAALRRALQVKPRPTEHLEVVISSLQRMLE